MSFEANSEFAKRGYICLDEHKLYDLFVDKENKSMSMTSIPLQLIKRVVTDDA